MSLPLQPLSLRHDIGDVIKDRYTVRAVLGAGAFGTVYRVEETLGSRTLSLACKEMHVLDDASTAVSEREQALAMFQEEAYLLQTLRHRHIPTAHFEPERGVWLACPVCGRTFRGARVCPDHGSTLQVVKERFYLVMDFIEGPDLEEKLLANQCRPLPEEQVLDWSLQVCDALAVVHEKGFSHRDIKPANIKLQASADEIMLIDFGLVKPSTVAGGYGTMAQSGRSQNLGTPGYAPPTPQEQAQPDARTDILALGMTLYRLLTGLDPTDAAQLEVMRAKSPAAFNARVSDTVNALIKKAIQPQPAQRYPSVAELLADLRAARYPVVTICTYCGWELRSAQPPAQSTPCGRCGRPLGEMTAKSTLAPTQSTPAKAAPTANTKPNPYAPQIAQLQRQIIEPTPPPLGRNDVRLREIEGELQRAESFHAAPSGECPACRRATLQHVSGKATSQCPICAQAKLQRRKFAPHRCPVCRADALQDKQLAESTLFCPLCHVAPLEEDNIKRFGGLATDVRWHCPHCASKFNVLNFGQAKLLECGPSVAASCNQWQGETLPIDEWRRMSNRAATFAECGECRAQFDAPDEENWKLVYAPRDPDGLAARIGERRLSRAAWKKIAHGFAAQAGELFCSHCEAEYDFTTEPRALILRQPGQAAPDWARANLNTPVALTMWYCAQAGKTSRRPGPLCSSCKTEWDEHGIHWKLVAASSILQSHLGEVLRPDEWHRRAAGVATDNEIAALRAEKARLQSQDARRRSQWEESEVKRRAALRTQLRETVKRAALEGHIPLQRVRAGADNGSWRSASIALVYAASHLNFSPRSGETVHWTSPAWSGALQRNGRELAWRSFAHGMLVVTSERILFGESTLVQWQHDIHQLTAADRYPTPQNTTVLDLQFSDRPESTLFEVGKVTWQMVIDGEISELTLTPDDLVQVLSSLK